MRAVRWETPGAGSGSLILAGTLRAGWRRGSGAGETGGAARVTAGAAAPELAADLRAGRRQQRDLAGPVSQIEHGRITEPDAVRACTETLGGTVDVLPCVGDWTVKVA
jgi:molybdopterin biosynthesis enzyme